MNQTKLIDDEVLAALSTHTLRSAKEIHAKLRERGVERSERTIYRAIVRLEAAGLVKRDDEGGWLLKEWR